MVLLSDPANINADGVLTTLYFLFVILYDSAIFVQASWALNERNWRIIYMCIHITIAASFLLARQQLGDRHWDDIKWVQENTFLPLLLSTFYFLYTTFEPSMTYE